MINDLLSGLHVIKELRKSNFLFTFLRVCVHKLLQVLVLPRDCHLRVGENDIVNREMKCSPFHFSLGLFQYENKSVDVCVCVLVDAYLVDTNTHVITHLSIISVKISID